MGIYKSLYYENLLSIIINFLLSSCSGTSKFGKIIARLAAFPDSLLFDRVSQNLKFLVTYICPNHLKLYMGIYKSLYYENLLSIIINFLLFSCSGTSNLAKLLQVWQLFSGSLLWKSIVNYYKFLNCFPQSKHFTIRQNYCKIGSFSW